jgi:hypothetical protein
LFSFQAKQISLCQFIDDLAKLSNQESFSFPPQFIRCFNEISFSSQNEEMIIVCEFLLNFVSNFRGNWTDVVQPLLNLVVNEQHCCGQFEKFLLNIFNSTQFPFFKKIS